MSFSLNVSTLVMHLMLVVLIHNTIVDS